MLTIDIISIFPEMFATLQHGIPGRAQSKNLLNIRIHNPRDFTDDKTGRVDDRPFGGGPGMVMTIQPLADTLAHIRSKCNNSGAVYLLSPQGKTLEQNNIIDLAENTTQLILICGRYEGIDERCMQFIDHEISIGDFVVSGGELPAMLLIDAISRFCPGALGCAESANQDSFCDGLLDHPHYTRPAQHPLGDVPDVLLSGDHQQIAAWRKRMRLERTCERRPDMIKNHTSSE